MAEVSDPLCLVSSIMIHFKAQLFGLAKIGKVVPITPANQGLRPPYQLLTYKSTNMLT